MNGWLMIGGFVFAVSAFAAVLALACCKIAAQADEIHAQHNEEAKR